MLPVACRCDASSGRRGRKLGSTYRSRTSAAGFTCVSASHACNPALMPSSFVLRRSSESRAGSRTDHQLEAVPVRVLKVNASVFPRAAAHGHSVLLQIGLERLVRAGRHIQGYVVQVIARRQGGITLLLEQRHPLRAGMQKHLPVVLSVDAHTQDLGVELLGAPYVSDVQHEMVDPGGLYHRSALLGSPDPASLGIYAARGAKSTRKRMALDTRGTRRYVFARATSSDDCSAWTDPVRQAKYSEEGIVKLVMFQIAGKPDVMPGLFTDRGVVSIADAVPLGATSQSTMTGIIDNFDRLRPALERLTQEGTAIPASDVRLRPPLAPPGKILACIANYWDHGALEARPLNMFPKSSDAVVGPGDTIVLPEFTQPWNFMH